MKIKPMSGETPLETLNKEYETERIINTGAEVEVSEDSIEEILTESGVLPKDTDTVNAKLKSYLNQSGGTLEKVAENIVNIMERGETDGGRLRAAEFISKIHGIQIQLEEEKAKPGNNVVNITIVGSGDKKLINFMMPKA
jgi:hypothetical protein